MTDTRAVYFIGESGGLIKIGVSANPSRRLAGLQTAAPAPLVLLAAIPGVGATGEHDLHGRFAGQRVHGEWFASSPDLLAVIAEAARDYPEIPKPTATATAPLIDLQRFAMIGERVAAEVRAEMARQRKTQADLAGPLQISATQVGRRLAGKIAFDVRELNIVAGVLGVPLARFLPVEPEPLVAERAS